MNVSVVIPLYNGQDSITDVLKGIESQTANDAIQEVIVINDGSKDDSGKVVEEYSKSSSLKINLITKENGGVAAARNRGVQEAETDWIAFCDSDDVWLPNKLERLFECINEHPEIDCIGSAYSDTPLRIGSKIIMSLHKGSVKDILISNFPQPSTVLMKKSVFEEIGGFDPKQRYAEDGNFFLRVAARYNLFYLPEKLIVYGYGKRAFGVGGLSSNLKAMYAGNVKNMKEMYALEYIGFGFYCLMRIYHWLKYCRRVIITKLTSKKTE